MFVRDQLTLLLDQVTRQTFPDLKFEGGEVFDLFPDLPDGVAEVAQTVVREAGRAYLQGRESNAIPVVQASAKSDTYPVQFFSACYPITLQNTLANDFARTNTMGGGALSLDSETILSEATMRAISERANNLLAYGRQGIELNSTATVSIPGFLNNPNVTIDTTVFDPNTATSQEIYQWFFRQVRRVSNNSRFAFRPNRVLLPDEFFIYIKERLLDNNVSVFEALMNSDQFEEIIPSYECQQELLAQNGIPNDGVDLAVFYTRDPRNVKAHTGLPTIAPEDWWPQEGLTRLVPIYLYITPTLIQQPLSMSYARVARPV